MHSECSKVSYYQPKNQHFFFIINQQPKFCAIFFSKINPDGHFGIKIKIFTFYKGDRGAGGLIALRSQRYVKKMEALRFLQQISHTGRKDISCNDVDSDSCWGVQNFFY